MSRQNPPRVMWLLNHGAARQFEIPMLKSIGINEIFLPKVIPSDHNFRSASVDYSEDGNLTIPPEDLALLNAVDWYGEPNTGAWEIANKHFDVAFFILHRFELLANLTRNFAGAAIWRAYGLDASIDYSLIVDSTKNGRGWNSIRQMGRRFWFGMAYPHLSQTERRPLQDRAIYLPLGQRNGEASADWSGVRKQLFFICPEIGFNPYYKKVYEEFRSTFSEFDYIVGGSQPIKVDDKRVLGYVPAAEHERNMRELRVLYYHSSEPNHVHYHPFEAVRAGMPLVFMAGGLLDRLGGRSLPGRCVSVTEAKTKIRRILDDDRELINEIRTTQLKLLDAMRPETCRPHWAEGFKTILSELNEAPPAARIEGGRKRKRIAVILPVQYRGGTLRAAKILAVALREGSLLAGEETDIVFGHVDDETIYSEEDFKDLPDAIQRRPFRWRSLDGPAARRAMTYAGAERWQPAAREYALPDDGMRQFLDCDLWLVASDRLPVSLLPVRPYVLLVHDYLQRYGKHSSGLAELSFLEAARLAERVLVTTKFTENDALQYAGIEPGKVFRVPMLAPVFQPSAISPAPSAQPYFIWPTNAAAHKNHSNAFKALRIYWEQLDGNLNCHITGVNVSKLFEADADLLKNLGDYPQEIATLRGKIRLRGELPDQLYQLELARAQFLWHPAKIDNGTFSVVDAAYVGVPSLSSDYPAMHEIDEQFALGLAWTPSGDPSDMAEALKRMEQDAPEQRKRLPSIDRLRSQGVKALASQYWTVLRECL